MSEGWRDQYERMLRSHKRLKEAAGPSNIGSDEARDALYRFFQDAYHLKDWIKQDPALTSANKSDIEALFNRTIHMQITVDLCNATKHLRLTTTRTGDFSTTVARQHVTVFLPPFETRVELPGSSARADPPSLPTVTKAVHRWEVVANGSYHDALQIADNVVAEWESWLRGKSLL